VIVLDDEVPSLPGGTFSVPTGTDTQGLSIVNPTLTRWKLIDPSRLSLPGDDTSLIGTLDQDGLFTATMPGTAHVYVFSGTLFATMSVTVN
jgi:hypothetical protein